MALGKGLGALITSTGNKKPRRVASHTQSSAPSGEDKNKLWSVPISEIHPDKNQPRKNFDQASLDELADSIKEHGILQPLLLREKSDGGYDLVAGERRYRAAKLAGLAEVPAMVKAIKDQQKVEISLIENIQREELNPLEEAFAFKRLIQEFNLTQEMVAKRVGKSRPAVANAIRLLDLPDEAKQALVDKKINSGQARALLGLKNEKDRLAMLSSMLGQKISVHDLEKKISKTKGAKTRRDPNLLFFEEELREILGTKVTITQRGENGKITIDYYSPEEFKQIIEKIIRR